MNDKNDNFTSTDTIGIINNPSMAGNINNNVDLSARTLNEARYNHMNANLYKLHKMEIIDLVFKLIIALIVFLAGSIAVILIATNRVSSIKNTTYGWYILLGIPVLISWFFWIKHSISISSIKNQLKNYRLQRVDITVTPSFVGNTYKSALRSNIIIAWLASWVTIYTLIFIGVVYWLNSSAWTYTSEKYGSNFLIDWPKIIEVGFGNVNTVLIIVASSLGVFLFVVLSRVIYNYRKMKTVEAIDASNINIYIDQANTKQLNKGCMIISLIVLALFLSIIVVPLVLIWRKTRRR